LDTNLPALKAVALVHGVVQHHAVIYIVWHRVAPAGARKLVLTPVVDGHDVPSLNVISGRYY
jgi:hypothetical protein